MSEFATLHPKMLVLLPQYVLACVGVIYVFVYMAQAWAAHKQAVAAREQALAARRDHVNNVYRLVFEKLDSQDVRGSRHYVYEMDVLDNGFGRRTDRKPAEIASLAFETEHWLELDTTQHSSDPKFDEWRNNKARAETIARALDQLGFLVREGIIPVNVIARFYTYPILKCWYKLCPYVNAVRERRGQKGHMWEWEHLVQTVIQGTGSEEGIWEGTRQHDNLEAIIDQIQVRTRAISLLTDIAWNPPDRFWVDT